MRKIKFRVWDKDLDKMHICGENIHDSMSFLNNQACYYNIQNGCGSLPKELGEGTYELMQFTGLHDKNGKEIYESDIILKTDTGSKFEVYYSENSACYRVKRQDGWHFDLSDIFPVDEWEIIGNVYEAITITCVRSTGLKA